MLECASCGRPLDPGKPCPKCPPGSKTLLPISTMTGEAGTAVNAAPVSAKVGLTPDFLERFTLLERLGKGGTGEVFRAIDRKYDLPVAIKFCLLAKSPSARERFKKEIALMATPKSPHLVHIRKAGEVGGIPYLVMPLIEGKSLRQVLKQEGKIPLVRAVEIVRQVLEALDEAHHHGIVHRDLKPENVMIDRSGQAMVLDLGIAKSWADGSATAEPEALTGTPAYMSPEQCRGQPTGVSSDLYSTGVMLFELITGVQPFGGSTTEAIIRSHLEDTIPRASSVVPEVDPSWDHLLARAMAKSPADRFQDARSFSFSLEKAIRGRFTLAPFPASRHLEAGGSLIGASPAARRAGEIIIGSFGLLAGWGLLTLDTPLMVAGVMPLTSIFLAEEPGRFSDLTAHIGARIIAYWFAFSGALCVGLDSGLLAPFITPIMMLGLLLLHLGWFGGYHARDPSDRTGIKIHRFFHVPFLLFTAFICLAMEGSSMAVGFVLLAAVLATLGLLRKPARTRHLSAGAATTMILMPMLADGGTDEDNSTQIRHAAAPRLPPAEAAGKRDIVIRRESQDP